MALNTIQKELVSALTGQNAHISFENTVRDFPEEYFNRKVKDVDYSCWGQLEHMRIAQEDILDFILNPGYKPRSWPESYWPSEEADKKMWENAIRKFLDDRNTIEELVRNRPDELTREIPHAPGYTLLREILLVIDHNAYHTGQLLVLRKALGIWEG